MSGSRARAALGLAVAAVVGAAHAQPGPWGIYMYMQGETIPKESNHVRLHPTQKDQWGIPLLVTVVTYDDNDEKMIAEGLEPASPEEIEAARLEALAQLKEDAEEDQPWDDIESQHVPGAPGLV